MRGHVLAMAFVLACGGSRENPRNSAKGVEITYSIDLDLALADRANEVRRDFEHLMAEEKITGTAVVGLDNTVVVTPREVAHRARIEANLADYSGTFTKVDCPADAGATAVCVRIAPSYATTVRKAALDEAVRTIRTRLAERKFADTEVRAQGESIVVVTPALDRDELASLRSLVARGGRLEFVVVDSGSTYMQSLYAHVNPSRDGTATEPAATAAEIGAEIDVWRAEDGGSRQTDYYLLARDRTGDVSRDEAKRIGCFGPVTGGDKVSCQIPGRYVLERYLRELAQRDPAFVVPADRRIAYEIVEPPPDARDRRPYARTYLLHARARLTGRAIANASWALDPNVDRPIVLLDFNRASAQTFGELTSEIVGLKLAILLDGRIVSAPVINSPIRGGRASITMSGTDPRRMEDDARELVTVLRAGALPAPLREESVRER